MLPKNTCPRCGSSFKEAQDLNRHLRSDEPCQKRDLVAALGIDESQEKRLKERKKSGSATDDAERWREIYLVLFPKASRNAVPSPCKPGFHCFARGDGDD